jgi:proline iminopeptidase
MEHTTKSPYTHSSAFDEGFLEVSPIHKLHYEQYGKVDGKPGMSRDKSISLTKMTRPDSSIVVFLHGGPGGSTSFSNTIYFNPNVYRVVLFDQRGAGKSTPSAEIRENTTPDLINDIESLRIHLKIPKWHLVFGGSWGSTLGLLYAQAHPHMVGSLVLRGIFTRRKLEREWSRGPAGAARIYPDAYEEFLGFLPENERNDPIKGHYKRLLSSDVETRLAAARQWNRWDITIGSLKPDEKSFEKVNDDQWSLSHALLEAHYFANGGWIEEGQILRRENIDKIRHIPSKYRREKEIIVT